MMAQTTDKPIDINEIKALFYNRLFLDFKGFMQHTSLYPDDRNAWIGPLNRFEKKMDPDDRPLIQSWENRQGKTCYPHIANNIDDDLRLVEAIEQFFDIFDDTEYLTKISQMMSFLTEGGNMAEMKEMTEDVILRQVTKQFWDELIGENEPYWYRDKIDGVPNVKQVDKDDITGKLDYAIVINGPLKHMLGCKKHYTYFLNIVRKIRNNVLHKWTDVYSLHDGYVLAKFKLFAYIGTVYFLRQRLDKPYEIKKRMLTVILQDESTDIGILDENGEPVTPQKTVNALRRTFKLSLYKEYRIRVNQQRTKTIRLDCMCLSPVATISNASIDFNGNAKEMASSARQMAFQTIVEDIVRTVALLSEIGCNTAEIKENALEQKGITRELLSLFKDVLSEFQKNGGYDKKTSDTLENIETLLNECKDIQERQLGETKKQNLQVQNGNRIAEETKQEVKKGNKTSEETLQEVKKGNRTNEETFQEVKNISHTAKKTNRLSMTQVALLATLVILALAAIGLFLANGRGSHPLDGLSPDELARRGDSLLRAKDYKEAGTSYKEALAGYKRMAAQDPKACVRLAEMYTLGKGGYSIDSALHFARMAKSEPTGRGHGWYAFLLLVDGKYDEAEREFPIAVDEDDEYMRMAKLLHKVQAPTANPSQQDINEAMGFLRSVKTVVHQMAYANICLHGIVRADSLAENADKRRYLMAPNFGQAFRILDEMVTSCPAALLEAGELDRQFGFYESAMEFFGKALYCGMDIAAAPILLLEDLCDPSYVKQQQDLVKLARGLANEQSNMGAVASHSVSYRDKGTLGHAVEDQEKLVRMTENGKTDDFYVDDVMLKQRTVTLLLLSGDAASRAKAVDMVAEMEATDDTLAVRWYLDAVALCLGKKDNDKNGNDKSVDSLVWMAADRGFVPAVAARLQTKRPYEPTSSPGTCTWNYSSDIPEAVYSRSPEVAFLMADMCARDTAFIDIMGQEASRKLFYKCLPYTPREYRIQNNIAKFFAKLSKWPENGTAAPPSLAMLTDVFLDTQAGLRAALDHGQHKMARQFCLYSFMVLDVMQSLYQQVVSPPEYFIPYADGKIEQYLDDGRTVDPSTFLFPLDYPIFKYWVVN